MNRGEDPSRVEQLKETLEERPSELVQKSTQFNLSPHETKIEVNTEWKPKEEQKVQPIKWHTQISLFKIFLASAILFFVASIGYLGYVLFFDPSGQPSEKNVAVRIEGPSAIAAGEEGTLSVVVSNKNRIPLAYANLAVVFPDGTQDPTDITKPLKEHIESLGQVPANTDIPLDLKTVFLGEENAEKKVYARLEYRLEGSNSLFVKESEFIVHITASPIDVVVDTLQEVNAGQEFEVTITLNANTREVLSGVLLRVEYPFGFEFTSASEKPVFSNNVWNVGNLSPGSKYAISFRGILTGEDSQEKVFRVFAGLPGRQEYDIGLIYGSALPVMTIKKPFLYTSLLWGHELSTDSVYVSQFGEDIIGRVRWRNNLPSRITNAEIEIHLTGTPIDKESVQVGNGGFYRSSDNMILWSERHYAPLAQINAGDSGEVMFNFSPIPVLTGSKLLRNPEITVEVSIKGKRTSETGVPEEVRSVITKKVRLTTELQFSNRLVHFIGPIKNTGPIPPKVDQRTTYTVIWSLVNTANAVKDVVVQSRLPIYAHWEEEVFPVAENIRYNASNGTITWMVGDVPSAAGITSDPKQIAFQISITPSLSQIGTMPDLLFPAQVTAVDTFTGAEISLESDALNTSAGTDPSVPRGGGVVVR